MTENKMEQVAALFGKKLDEPFIIDLEGVIFEGKFTVTGFKAVIVDE